MNLRRIFFVLALFALGLKFAFAQTSKSSQVESRHVAGRDGLQGWTLNGPIPDDSKDDVYPFTLIIARNRKVVREIKGNAFIWRWIFWDDGRQIAYESGPLHFGMQCELYDLQTGKVLRSVDSWRGIPKTLPPGSWRSKHRARVR